MNQLPLPMFDHGALEVSPPRRAREHVGHDADDERTGGCRAGGLRTCCVGHGWHYTDAVGVPAAVAVRLAAFAMCAINSRSPRSP